MSDDQQLVDLLTASTVRIDIGGEVSGTGFVVAPGQILTCHHVLAPALERSEGLNLVTVLDPRRPGYKERPLEQPVLDRTSDVALLRVRSTADLQPVLLGDSAQVDDPVFVYGFTSEKPQGTPGTLVVEGIQGGPPRLVKMKNGQVVPGLSGAPALNRRTGMVLGIVRRSRDVDSDLGGLAIPTDVVAAVVERLRRDNAEFHRQKPRWVRTMSPEQAAAYERLDAAPPGPSKDLTVEVGQEDERWTVSITCPTAEEDWGTAVRIDLNVLRPDVAKLFRMLKASGRLTQVQQSHVVGQALAKALWTDEVQARLRHMLEDTSGVLDISLIFGAGVDEDLRYLPWETMYLPATRPSANDAIRFSSHTSATLARTLIADRSDFPPPMQPLKVTVLRSPGERDDDRLQRAAQDVAAIAERVATVTQVPSDDFGRATPLGLIDVLRSTTPTVLHYVGCGRFSEGRDELELDGYPDAPRVWVRADDLSEFVQEQPPALVILQASKMSDSEVPVDLTVFAPALLDVGVLAVLAFPLPVDAEAAKNFFEEFYKQVGAGASVRTAVQRGRNKLETGRRPWAFPALLLTSPGDLRLAPGRGTG